MAAILPDGAEIDLQPRPCGAGCFTQALTLGAGRTTLQGSVRLPDREGGTFTTTLAWPPAPEQPDRVDEVLASTRTVTSMRVAETVWTGSAGGEPAAGQGFEISGEEFLTLMPYGGGGAVDVRPLADDASGLQFYLPGSRTLFTV